MAALRLLLKKEITLSVIRDVILVNAVTNPLLNVFLLLTGLYTAPVILLSETLVICAEAILYHLLERESWKYCFFISLALNLFSYFIGGVLYGN
ncbi:MAG: hypothetical protein ACI4ET_14070 [Bilifractor sp.]